MKSRIMLFLSVLGVMFLAGCTDSPELWQPRNSGTLKNVSGLEDCKATQVYTGSGYIWVVRCPNSTVTTRTSAKHTKTTVTIDGVEYVEKSKAE